MPRSDRSLVVAAIFGLVTISGGIGATLASTWTSPPSYETEQEKASAESRYAEAITRKGEVAAANYAAYHSKQANRCYNAENHDSADLCAQWRAAVAAEKAAETAWWSMWWVIIGTALSGVGLAALIYTLRQTERSIIAASHSNEIAQDTAKRQLRAYLYPGVSQVRISKDTNTVKCPVDIYLRNSGNTPAKILVYRFIYYVISPITILAAEESGDASNVLITDIHTKIEKVVGPNSDIFLSFKAPVPLAHFNDPDNPVQFWGSKDETVLLAFFSWSYVDYLGRQWDESAEFTTDAIDWDLKGPQIIQMRQIRSKSDLT